MQARLEQQELPPGEAIPSPEGFHRLKICSTTAHAGVMDKTIEATFIRGFDSMYKRMGTKSGAISVVGSGPSLKRHLHELTGDIFATNGAIKYLVSQGIMPTYQMVWDCTEISAEFLVPGVGSTFILASRCDPAVFEKVKDEEVWVWHAAGDASIEAIMEKYDIREPMVNGGSAAVDRAIFVAGSLGYKDIHMFGVDSSWEQGDSHVAGSLVDQETLPVMCSGFDFITTPQMAAQANDFPFVVGLAAAGGLHLTVHGEGLLPTIAFALETQTNYPIKVITQDKSLQEKRKNGRANDGQTSDQILSGENTAPA